MDIIFGPKVQKTFFVKGAHAQKRKKLKIFEFFLLLNPILNIIYELCQHIGSRDQNQCPPPCKVGLKKEDSIKPCWILDINPPGIVRF